MKINWREKALDVLIQQPEVDPERVSIVGYSEGTTIVPRVAIDNPGKVNKIVLMGSIAQGNPKLMGLHLVICIRSLWFGSLQNT